MKSKLNLEGLNVQQLSVEEIKKVNGGNTAQFETHGGVVYEVWWYKGVKYYREVEYIG